MENARPDVHVDALARCLGEVLRLARMDAGLSRKDLAVAMGDVVQDRSITSYELGERGVTVVRFYQICKIINADAPALFAEALEMAGDVQTRVMKVDFNEVMKDDTEGYESVRKWARVRRRHGGRGQVTLHPATVREMAILVKMTHVDLACYLARFAVSRYQERFGSNAQAKQSRTLDI